MAHSAYGYLIQLASAPDLADQVYRVLLDAIGDGSLAPGQRITQEDIAEHNRLRFDLRFDGWAIDVKRTCRICREESLMVRKRQRKNQGAPSAEGSQQKARESWRMRGPNWRRR